MRPLSKVTTLTRALLAILLLLPGPGTAAAANRVVEAPQKGVVVAPVKLPTLPKLDVANGLNPNFQTPVVAMTVAPLVKPTAVAQATAILPEAHMQPAAQNVYVQEHSYAAFDGANTALGAEDLTAHEAGSGVSSRFAGLSARTPSGPKVLTDLPPLKSKTFRMPWAKTKIKLSGGLGWSLLVPAGFLVPAAAGFLGLAVVATAGFIAFFVASPLAPKEKPEPPSTLSAEQRAALRDNAQKIVDGLVVRMGLPKNAAPRVRLTNDTGSENAWASGTLDGKGEIGLGEKMSARGDRELSAILAHELGHMYHKDSENRYAYSEDAGRVAGFITLWSVLATAGGLLMGSEAGVSLAGVIAAGAGGAVASLASALVAKASRVMERRADAFAAWLTAPGWMATYFRGQAKKEKGMSDPFSTHPDSWKRLRDMRRLGWNEGSLSVKNVEQRGPFQLPGKRPLEEWKARGGDAGIWALSALTPLLIFAAPVAAFVAFGAWLGMISLMTTILSFLFRAYMLGRDERDRPVTLGEIERLFLQRRARLVLDGLFDSLGVAPAKRPKILISNQHGKDNAWVRGELENLTIGLGQDWAGRSDRQLAVVLAHELGHVFNKDSRALGTKLSALIAKSQFVGAAVAALGAGLAMIFGEHFGGVLWAALALLSPAALYLAGKANSRLRERRADRFAAWLTSGRWLAEFFSTLRPRPGRWTSTHPSPGSRIEFGLLEEVKRMRKALGRTPKSVGPKGPGTQEHTTLH